MKTLCWMISAANLLFVFLLLPSCSKKIEIKTLHGRTMGTTYAVKFIPVGKPENFQEKIDKILIDVNLQMSTYIKDSEISQFNKVRRVGEWTSISPQFFQVVEHAMVLAKETGGVFDPTLGPLVNLWGFGPDGKRKVPTDAQIAEAKNKSGYNKIELEPNGKKLRKKKRGVYLDLSASAKGHGVDRVAGFLESQNITNYMVEIGGEIKTSGTKGGVPWKIAIEAPEPQSQKPYQKILQLNNMAMATSGDYRNFFKAGDKHYSHTIDHKSGKPVAHTLASVSVLDQESCMKADALATALMAMGPKKGFEFAESKKIAAYFIFRELLDNKSVYLEKSTTRFNQWVNRE